LTTKAITQEPQTKTTDEKLPRQKHSLVIPHSLRGLHSNSSNRHRVHLYKLSIMKTAYEDNNKRIDILQKQIKQLKSITDEGLNLIGEMQEELQSIQSQNDIMRLEMEAGKNID